MTKFTTDAIGCFEILLKPGHYVVVLAENRFPKPCGPFEISVEPGKMTTLNGAATQECGETISIKDLCRSHHFCCVAISDVWQAPHASWTD